MTPLPPTIRNIASIFSNERIITIMNIIQNGPLNVKHIQSRYIDVTGEYVVHATISQQLKKLRHADLVTYQKVGVEVYYQLKTCKAKEIKKNLKNVL